MTISPDKNQSSRGGLALLSPTLRLAFVFTLSVLYIFINDLLLAAALMILGIIVYILSSWRNKALAIAAVFPGIMLLVYNSILSPAEAGGWHWGIFTVNQAGVTRGLVTGMRLIGVMLVSFSWLAVTSIPEMYQGLTWLKPAQAWVLELLRGIQIIKREFIALTQSLIIRGLKWDSPIANIKNLMPLAMAIIPRVADNAQKTTFAMQSHQPAIKAAPSSEGIHVAGASVRYSPRLPDVLHDVSLDVKPGEFVYLAGPDMAGKTTLLRLMGGVIPRIMGEYKGDVRVNGMVTHDIPLSELSHIARYVAPEPFSSIYGLTVGQEISFLAQDERTGRDLLKRMGIEHLWDRETTKLSGGQQVRLVLAGALASKARYLLLDSPMQELDPAGRADFMEALNILNTSQDVTVLVADPFWKQLESYARRVVVMESGIISADLSPAAFFTSPWLERCHLNASLEKRQLPTPGDRLAGLENVHVRLEDNHILKGVSLDIHQGEFLAVMGPNGSGKTTAMLTLAGAIRPFQGQVNARGRRAYVFQDARLQIVADTVHNELHLGPNILKWPREQARAFVEKGLQWSGLEPDTNPLDLHPAQARMLEIAACNTNADVLILDEPTVGLDALGIQKVISLVDQQIAQGKGVIVITHDEGVARLAHRTLVIRDGLVAGETPQ